MRTRLLISTCIKLLLDQERSRRTTMRNRLPILTQIKLLIAQGRSGPDCSFQLVSNCSLLQWGPNFSFWHVSNSSLVRGYQWGLQWEMLISTHIWLLIAQGISGRTIVQIRSRSSPGPILVNFRSFLILIQNQMTWPGGIVIFTVPPPYPPPRNLA